MHFLKKFSNLRESMVRNFKKAYTEKLTQESKKLNPQPITRIVTQPKGKTPILLELDDKLWKFLLAIRAKGGVIKIHVVYAQLKHLLIVTLDHHSC